MLEYLQNNLWIVKQPLVLLGVNFGTVMTVVKLKDNSLWIHSPVDPNEELLNHLNSLGEVSTVISPNNFHHLFAPAFMDEHPDAHYFYAPGIEKKQKHKIHHIKNKSELKESTQPSWGDEIEILKIGGMPFLDEFVFYHKSSQTLIACDLIFKLHKNKSILQNLLFPIMGIKDGEPCQSRLFKSCIRDKNEYNKAIEHLKTWDVDRLIVGHGGVIEKDAHTIIPNLMAV